MKPFAVQFLPVVRVWGGHRLAAWGRCAPGSDPIGESWEVHGAQPVRGGDCTLDEMCKRHGRALLGDWYGGDPNAGFPLLTKWLDCQEWLSVQVHPDDSVARRLAGPDQRGKAEAWYFAEVSADAEVIHGWNSQTPSRQVLESLSGGKWLPAIRRFHPQAQSWAYTAPGTVHALGPGLLVFEVQQSSDLTYRLYDWDRLGLDGEPREMHLTQGVEAICQSLPEPESSPPQGLLGQLEIVCPHFCIESVQGSRSWSPAGQSVELLTALDGPASLECQGQSWPLGVGDSLVIPAQAGQVQWRCHAPEGRWIRVRLAPPGPGVS